MKISREYKKTAFSMEVALADAKLAALDRSIALNETAIANGRFYCPEADAAYNEYLALCGQYKDWEAFVDGLYRA